LAIFGHFQGGCDNRLNVLQKKYKNTAIK
jgi:hypothetical protein